MWTGKYLTLLLNLLLGSTFIFSGIVKLNDSRSFAYKIEEYLYVLASQFTRGFYLFLPCTAALAISIATVEVVLGTAALVYWERYWTLLALLCLTLFFTALTLYTALSARIASCGCFGSALALTPWQSFGKSVVLLLCIGVLTWQAAHAPVSSSIPGAIVWVVGALVGALGLGIGTYCYLPIRDTTPYRIGSDLHQLWHTSRPARTADGDTPPVSTTVHQETAETLQLCIWQDQKECTQDLLTGHKILLIVQSPDTLPSAACQKLRAFATDPARKAHVMLLCAAGQGKALASMLQCPRYTAHLLLLREMLKTPTGALQLQDGIVVDKWHYRDLVRIPPGVMLLAEN